MRLIKFENHRKEKTPNSEYISVVNIDNKIESGWTCGRTEEEVTSDFGKQDVDWFYLEANAHAQVIKNRTIEG